MQIVSVSIGRARPIQNGKPSGRTGIFKTPVDGPVQVTVQGLVGDFIADAANHGGADQAVYVYGAPDYAWWSSTLGRTLVPGTFGENLTVTGLESARVCIGDRFHVGTACLEVTAPRIPCQTLAARMGDPAFVKHFRQAERPGLYCRVIQEGAVRAGNPVRFEPYEGETISALALFRDFFSPDLTEETLRRHLAAPIALRARRWKEDQLQVLLAQKNDDERPDTVP